jgi:diguanylate cyclase (GGDEF)-like protein
MTRRDVGKPAFSLRKLRENTCTIASGDYSTPISQRIRSGVSVNHYETVRKCKEGNLIDVSVSLSPIRDQDGNIIGASKIGRNITERKAAEEQIHHLAFYDILTQLPNRRMLNDRLGHTMAASKRSDHYGAVLFLDLDNFKPVNDTYGHDVGDLLLIEAARRISSCVREMDTVARFAGDEFVVMLSELDEDKTESTAQASVVAEKIRTMLAEPYLLTIQQESKAECTVEHHCTSSIGVELFIDHEASSEDIIKWADKAMYQAKEAGRNLIRFYKSKA